MRLQRILDVERDARHGPGAIATRGIDERNHPIFAATYYYDREEPKGAPTTSKGVAVPRPTATGAPSIIPAPTTLAS